MAAGTDLTQVGSIWGMRGALVRSESGSHDGPVASARPPYDERESYIASVIAVLAAFVLSAASLLGWATWARYLLPAGLRRLGWGARFGRSGLSIARAAQLVPLFLFVGSVTSHMSTAQGVVAA